MLRGFLTVGGWTMLSRVLGLVRDQLLAAFLGAGPIQDAYQVAFRLPNMFRQLFGEGALNTAFVPLFSAMLTTDGTEKARRFASETFSVLLTWLTLIAVLGEIFMPQVVSVIAAGFPMDGDRYHMAVSLSRITFPYLVLICAAALVSGVLNGLHRFGVAAAAYVSFNVVGIAAILLLPPLTGDVGKAAAWGVTASGVAQLGLLLLAVRRAGFRLMLMPPRLTARIHTLIRRMAIGCLGSGISQINLLVDTIIASYLPAGSVSFIYFADRINQLPLGVLGAAAGTTLLPVLSRHVAAKDHDGAHSAQNRAIDYAMVLTLPAALGMIVLAHPIIATLFQHGAFTPRDAMLSAQSLRAFAIGLPAFVLIKVLAPGFFARGDTATPVRIGLFTLTLNFVLNLLLMHPLLHAGPPLASSLAAIVNVATLGFVLRRRGLLHIAPATLSRVARMMLAALGMAAVLLMLNLTVLGPLAVRHGPLRIVALMLLVTAGMLAYGLGLQLLGVMELRAAGTMLRARLARRRGSAA
ncbi:murein biosynthesis integral membrane protein MurJ [Gluconacetobacter tumulicola]|uniref:Probable lipid II flippase MurJ n=1 Tax=Gluconacetobacter tumulicola TaxID=1017177 RepID=A0A7W4P876_9PROT|nr:murein biosynthesis integral membrane protein MurJ [Gluconacetobacter tumulicola]MBB2179098.1 murein biosynthesis integral membrane protein MurJ [Gluconacetobacter tumulicola]